MIRILLFKNPPSRDSYILNVLCWYFPSANPADDDHTGADMSLHIRYLISFANCDVGACIGLCYICTQTNST